MKIQDFTLVYQDWIRLMIFKNFADRTGSDTILSNQDWTRTEIFHSPLISGSDIFTKIGVQLPTSIDDIINDIITWEDMEGELYTWPLY